MQRFSITRESDCLKQTICKSSFIALGLAGPILVILYSLFEMLDP